METIEFETHIDENGHIDLPGVYEHVYGKPARVIILLPDKATYSKKKRKAGSAKGILQVLIEDDKHLDDFEKYMS